MMNMTELCNQLARRQGFTKARARRVVDTVLGLVREELSKGEGSRVRLRNFGTFEARKSHGKVRAKFDDSRNFFKKKY